LDKTEWPQQCASCGATHEQMWGSWVILGGSAKLVCANDRCWRKQVEREKHDSDDK